MKHGGEIFNGAQGARKKDERAIAYFTSPNQRYATRTSSVYGAQTECGSYTPCYPVSCCSANSVRIVPEFVQSIGMVDEQDELYLLCYGPAAIKAPKLDLTTDTLYPFRDRIMLKVTRSDAAQLYLRIPGWCKEPKATVNSKQIELIDTGNGFVRVDAILTEGDVIELHFPMEIKIYKVDDSDSASKYPMCIERGPLVYALPIPTRWEAYAGHPVTPLPDGWCWYEAFPDTEHPDFKEVFMGNGVFARSRVIDEDLDPEQIQVVEYDQSGYVWENPPVTLKVPLYLTKGERTFLATRLIDPWEATLEADGEAMLCTLVPHGCTNLRITYPFAPKVAVERILKAECLAEEMRILYVAMTRAKEKLILVGAVRDIGKKINNLTDGGNNRIIPVAIVSECNSYLDWIVTALSNHPDCSALRKKSDTERKIIMDDSRFSVELIEDASLLISEDVQADFCPQPKEEQIIEKILPLLSFQYPNEADTVLPSKITVTELKRRTQSMEEGGVYLFPPERVLHTPSGRLTGAQIGTAYHTVMQHLDLSLPLKTREDIRLQITAIKEQGFLTDEEAGAVNPEKIVKFFSSNAGKMMLSAKWVKREVMFGILETASALLASFESDKPIMLQGVIDCVLETDKELCIIDYKTDKTYHPEDTVEKYKIQLECYAMAAERIFQKKVTSKILYLFDADTPVAL